MDGYGKLEQAQIEVGNQGSLQGKACYTKMEVIGEHVECHNLHLPQAFHGCNGKCKAWGEAKMAKK